MANEAYKISSNEDGLPVRNKLNTFIDKAILRDEAATTTEQLRLLKTATYGNVDKTPIYVCSTEAELKLVLADNSVVVKIALLTVPIELTGTFSIYGVTRVLGNEIRIEEDITVTANTSIGCGIYIEGSLVLSGDRIITFNNASSGLLRIYCIGLDSAPINSNASINLDGTDVSIVWYQNLYDRVTINNSNVNKSDWLYPSGNQNRQFRNVGNGDTITSAIPKGSVLVGLVCYPNDPAVDFGVMRVRFGPANITNQTFSSGIIAYWNSVAGLVYCETNIQCGGDMYSIAAIEDDVDLNLVLTGTDTNFTIKTICKSIN